MARAGTGRPSPRPTLARLAVAATLGVLAAGAVDGPRSASVPRGASARPAAAGAVGGPGHSGLFIQSRDCDMSVIALADFVRQSGGPATHFTISSRATVGCGAGWIYPQSEASHSGGRYAVAVSSDGAIGLLEATDWPSTGGHALDGASEPGTDVVLPWVGKRAGSDLEGLSSFVSIQNADANASASAEVAVFPVGATQPIAVFERAIGPGASVTLPFGGARDLELVRLPEGLVGYARVRSPSPVAVQAFVDSAVPGIGVAGIEGEPAARAEATLVAPLVYNAGPDGGTWLAVVNPGPDATDVNVAYRPDGPGCPTGPIVHGGRAHPLAGGAMALFDQREGASGLPAGCRATATVEAAAGGRLVATVMAAGVRNGTLAGYAATRATDGGRHMLVPAFANRVTGSWEISTGISAMNVGDRPADVVLSVRDASGADVTLQCPECRQRIQPLEAHLWHAATMPSLQGLEGLFGSAVVLGDQPLAVVFADAAARGSRDTGMANAIAAIEAGAPPATRDPGDVPPPSLLPLVLFNASLEDDDGTRPWAVGRVSLPVAASRATLR